MCEAPGGRFFERLWWECTEVLSFMLMDTFCSLSV